jgi:Membrane domain of glycerophosphoryl diester phosphodiesterase
MDLALRPMSTSQVLDRTFQLYRSHFVLLAGIGALLPAMLLIMQLGFIPLGFPPRADRSQPPEALAIALLGFVCCYGIVYVLGQALTSGAVVFAVSKLHLGKSVTIGQAYKQVFSRFWRILGVIVLISLIVFGTLVVGEIIAILIFAMSAGSFRGFSGSGVGPAGGIMLIFAFIWGIGVFLAGAAAALYFYSRLALAVPACILEGLSVGSAFQRSWFLSKNSVWRIILAFLLTWALGVILVIVLGVPGQIYAAAMGNKGLIVGLILQQIGGFIAGVLATPISVTAIALIYYDQRVRKEAFDLQLMMEAVGEQPPQTMAAAAQPPIG